MKLWQMTDEQRKQYRQSCYMMDNIQAICELNDFEKFYNQVVRIVKGKKYPIGTQGIVRYVARKHYGKNEWLGWSTRIGIKIGDEMIFTDVNNVEIL